MPDCSVLGSCKNTCYKSRPVLISTYCCMIPHMYSMFCVFDVQQSWCEMGEIKGKQLQHSPLERWEIGSSLAAVAQLQGRCKSRPPLSRKRSELPRSCNSHSGVCWMEISALSIKNMKVWVMSWWGCPPLLSEHPNPWQGQEEGQSGCTRLAAHRGMDPGCTRQERDGNPGQCHPGCRTELLSYQVKGQPCTSHLLWSLSLLHFSSKD